MGDPQRFRYNYFEDGFVELDDVAEEHRRRVLHQVNLRFELRDTTDPFPISLTEFTNLYRIPQHLVMEVAGILAPHMFERAVGHYVPLEIKVLCALAFYGGASYQRFVGRMSCVSVSQSMVSRCVSEVTEALNSSAVLQRFIHFLATRAEREEVILRNNRFGLPRVLGFADGTLIKITRPPLEENQQAYYCTKGFTAINAHIVCDADLRILSINCQYPGSCTDPFIFRNCGLRDVMITAYNESRCWLLGDSAYAEEPWMHTPILDAAPGTPKYLYTQCHCKGRNCIERLNGALKNRWRCLIGDRALHYRPQKAGMIMNACAVLHNFCKSHNLPDPVVRNHGNQREEEEEEIDVPIVSRRLRLLARQEQQFMIDFVQQQRGLNV